jgi:uncharacterized protein (DUF1684 family)
MEKIKPLIFFILTISILSCKGTEYKSTSNKDYLGKINSWHEKRIENLKKESGWLNLVGLYWLKEGENTFGADKQNDIVFPQNKADEFIGRIIKNDTLIFTEINPDIKVYHDGEAVRNIEMKSDVSGDATILSHKTLKWFIIKRGEKYGVRLRDLEAELLSSFKGIERFPVQDKWKIKADYIKHEKEKKIMVPSILGTVSEEISYGMLEFTVDDQKYSLEPIRSGKGLFIIFADLTSGESTYGAGRFLYTDGPDSNNTVILDFNKSYNPPCAFTKYATCPLPPDENRLKLKITAGEKNFGEGH